MPETPSSPSSFLSVAKFLYRTLVRYPKNALFIVFLTGVVGLFEGLGLGLLLPIVEQIGLGSEDNKSEKAALISNAFEQVGIPETLANALLVFFFIQLVRCILVFILQARISFQKLQLTTDLREKLFTQLNAISWPTLQKYPSGYLINTLVNETYQFGNAFLYGVNFLAQAVTVTVYLSVALMLNWQITSSILVIGALSFFFLKPIFNSGKEHAVKSVEFRNSLQSMIQEFFNSTKLIQVMNLQSWANKRFYDAAKGVQKHMYTVSIGAPMVRGIFEPVAVGFLCLTIYFGLVYFQMKPAEFAVLLLIFIRLTPQFSQLQEKLHGAYATYGIERATAGLMNTLAKDPGWQNQSGSPVKFNEGIHFKDIEFSHVPDEPVLRGLDLRINKGDTVAVIGPSGSGKTTLIDLLIGLYRPTKGKILVDGKDLATLDLEDWRVYLGYVGQEAQFFHLTIRENLLLGIENRDEDSLWRVLAMADAENFVREFPQGLETIVGDRGIRLSGGQRQRLALARALLHEPQILILDEATSSLDRASEIEVQKSIRKLKERFTIIMIAHRISTVRDADIIVELDRGKIVRSGTFDELGLDQRL